MNDSIYSDIKNDPRGPLSHDTDDGPCKCGAWHNVEKDANHALVRKLRVIQKAAPCECGYTKAQHGPSGS